MDAMRVLEPRLLRQAGSARGYLAVTVALGLAGAVLILFQADLLSRALAGAARGTGIAALSGVLAWLGVVVAGRAVLTLTALASFEAVTAFDLLPGRRVALTGPNGAGKSTVASVLLRFAEVTSGRVTLNGHDLASYSADEVRTRIGGCPQDPHIFDASLRDNLRLARPGATDEQLAEAAARVRLLDWIESLPLRWDTPVGAHGAALSGGQRQRLAVARALLADPDLLILDEPTAHLDPGTRSALLGDLLAATAGRTMLLITHDLDGLDELDQVITLEGGKVANVYLLRDPGSGFPATRCPARLRGAQCSSAGGPDRAARFT